MSTGSKHPNKNTTSVFGKLPDFRDERTAVQHTVENKEHILLLSLKCHTEVAGVGIEYSWGMAKRKFRHKINDDSDVPGIGSEGRASATRRAAHSRI